MNIPLKGAAIKELFFFFNFLIQYIIIFQNIRVLITDGTFFQFIYFSVMGKFEDMRDYFWSTKI